MRALEARMMRARSQWMVTRDTAEKRIRNVHWTMSSRPMKNCSTMLGRSLLRKEEKEAVSSLRLPPVRV